MTWFEEMTGVEERGGDYVRSRLSVAGGVLSSAANGRGWRCGELETPTVAELRARAGALRDTEPLKIREIVGDIRELHIDPANAGAMFQVASYFNLLEMTRPAVTPEDGVGIYENDGT